MKDTLLEELDLPNIEYPIPTYIFSESLETDNIPFGAMLFGLQNIIDRLLKWEVELFCTDSWEVHQEVIYEDRLFQSKAETYYLE